MANLATKAASKAEAVLTITAPSWHMTKAAIVAKGIELGVTTA